MPRIGFAHWRSPQTSGGNLYDDQLIDGLPAAGIDLRLHQLDGPWPVPRRQDRDELLRLIALEDHWLMDNIIASAAPEVVVAGREAGKQVTVMMHYFPADDPSLPQDTRVALARSEAATVRAASAVIVPSAWAAAEVRSRYGRHDAVVAHPGVQPGQPAPGSATGTPHLLWLSRLTHGKDPLTFLTALIALAELDWTATLVGPADVDPALTAEVKYRIAAAGLGHRINVTGPREGATLDAVWHATDLLVHTSRAEMFGMVVAEAAARGIPSVVADGTGAMEAQYAGAHFPSGNAAALSQRLRSWLTDDQLRRRWRTEAAARRTDIRTWPDTVAIVAATLRH